MNCDRKISVLVIDADARHTVDIVRSLGRHGVDCSILSAQSWPPARFSRYVHSAIVNDLSPLYFDTAMAFLEGVARRLQVDVLISSGLKGFQILSRGREKLEEIARVPVARLDAFSVAEDKAETIRFAQSIGLKVPETWFPSGLVNSSVDLGVRFPVVVKARRGQGHFGYARNPSELERVYSEIRAEVPDQVRDGLWPIIQEYIPGKGHGFYGLANRGQLRAYFMHERIREVPPSGGPSSMARTYFDEELARAGGAALSALNWHGVAMVEFKKDARDGCYKLIEINPKFWGSLGLSIAAGVDFPYLLVKMALDGDIAPVSYSAKNITYQWLSMDMAHAWAVRKPWLWLGPVLNGVPNDFATLDPLPNFALIAQGLMDTLRGQRPLERSRWKAIMHDGAVSQ